MKDCNCEEHIFDTLKITEEEYVTIIKEIKSVSNTTCEVESTTIIFPTLNKYQHATIIALLKQFVEIYISDMKKLLKHKEMLKKKFK